MAQRLTTYGKSYNIQAWAEALANRTPFVAGSMKGTDQIGGTGRLPNDWARTFQARRDVIDFAIYSYGTPIAWHDTEAGWVMPDESYSSTTSKQQGKIRYALSVAGIEMTTA